MNLLYAVTLLLFVIACIQVFLIIKQRGNTEVGRSNEILFKISNLFSDLSRIELAVREEIAGNRKEMTEGARSAREEWSNALTKFGDTLIVNIRNAGTDQKEQLAIFSNSLQSFTKLMEDRFSAFSLLIEIKLREANESNMANAKDNRSDTKDALLSFKTEFSKSIDDFNKAQSDNFHALLQRQSEQYTVTNVGLEKVRETVEKKIGEMQTGNERKLEEMRATVDEKLKKTLETRLGESFKLVSDRLEAVHKGLGDMQQLATGVGDLKRVLSNVKTRGIMGEYQLENLLDQLLTVEQFSKNVKTKVGSNALVEFAVKLPGREDREKVVWLPIDSKFPKEAFELLMEAYETGTPEQIEANRKLFAKGIKICAGDICEKYIDPPNTTDFAILFLPFESLYAEVLRTPGLFESIQRECKIIVTGPTTLSALLNSLQMGFKTLAIEKRSSEVWELLGAVKTEFGNFGGILEKTQKKLLEASNVIEKASVRSRAIERKLKDVQGLPKEEASVLLEVTSHLQIIEDDNQS